MAFKMKGSPMQRNFGIGTSPIKSHKPGHEGKVKEVKSDSTYEKAKKFAKKVFEYSPVGQAYKAGENVRKIYQGGKLRKKTEELEKHKSQLAEKKNILKGLKEKTARMEQEKEKK